MPHLPGRFGAGGVAALHAMQALFPPRLPGQVVEPQGSLPNLPAEAAVVRPRHVVQCPRVQRVGLFQSPGYPLVHVTTFIVLSCVVG